MAGWRAWSFGAREIARVYCLPSAVYMPSAPRSWKRAAAKASSGSQVPVRCAIVRAAAAPKIDLRQWSLMSKPSSVPRVRVESTRLNPSTIDLTAERPRKLSARRMVVHGLLSP
jgi:hypothetical protein